MMPVPILSVIIPVYNVERYLDECLDSVLAQSAENMEVICVNDGATDASAAVLERYAARDARIRVVTKENGGLSSARNAGLAVATGKYVGFVDSDDYVHPFMFARLLDVAESNGADVVECGVRLVIEGMDDVKVYLERKSHEVPHEEFPCFRYEGVHQTLVYVWNKLYSRELLQRAGAQFHEGLNGEDLLFNAAVLPFCRSLYRLNDRLYYYRFCRPDSITGGFCAADKAIQGFGTFLQQLRVCAATWKGIGIFEKVGASLFPLTEHLFRKFFFNLPASARREQFDCLRDVLQRDGWVDLMVEGRPSLLLQKVIAGQYIRVVVPGLVWKMVASSPRGNWIRRLCFRAAVALSIRQ